MKKTVITKIFSLLMVVLMIAATMTVGAMATETEAPAEDPEITAPVAKIAGASVIINDGITLRYRVTAEEGVIAEGQKLAMQFTIHTVDGSFTSNYHTGTGKNGEYIFKYADISPQYMSSLIDAKLVVLNSDDSVDRVLTEKNGYSIKQYAQSMLIKYADDENMVQFISNMLAYGAAAQAYKKNSDDLATDGVVGMVEPKEYLPEETDRRFTPAVAGYARFKSVTVHFGDHTEIYIKLSTFENVVVKVIDPETGVAKDCVRVKDNDGNDTEYITGGIVTLPEFDKVYTFELYENGAFVQVLKYSIRSYVYSNMNNTEADGTTLTDMAKLSRALYSYGKALEVYKATLETN